MYACMCTFISNRAGWLPHLNELSMLHLVDNEALWISFSWPTRKFGFYSGYGKHSGKYKIASHSCHFFKKTYYLPSVLCICRKSLMPHDFTYVLNPLTCLNWGIVLRMRSTAASRNSCRFSKVNRHLGNLQAIWLHAFKWRNGFPSPS